MHLSPRFLKYRTPSGNCYVYDPGTNEIIHIGEVTYEVLDDFGVLDSHEISEKHCDLGQANVGEALTQLGGLQSGGMLRDCTPRISSRAERICYDAHGVESFHAVLENRRGLLILEITQKCNLRCEYCCYGKHYKNNRKHGEATMSFEVAQKAIVDYINHCPRKCSIGFYGGEPLMEFELLKKIVIFAQDSAREHGMQPRFNLTTNGTLLSDEIIHFLVKNNFSIFVSLDGDKESHNRFRVFRNDAHPERREGSYDVVMRNLHRFVELYPNKKTHTGIRVTLTASTDRAATDDLLRRLRSMFPMVLVSAVQEPDRQERPPRPFEIGAWRGIPCGSGSCESAPSWSDGRCEAGGLMENERLYDEADEKMRKSPDFADWGTEERIRLARSRNKRFVECIRQHPDPDAIREEFPIAGSLFQTTLYNFHHRTITRGADKCIFAYHCQPAVTRLFCSTEGVYYPCEKTDRKKLFELGDIDNGVDGGGAVRLTEAIRLLGDCGNCVARNFCALCPAIASDPDNSARADGLAYQKSCRRQIWYTLTMLAEYTAMMEMNQEFMERYLHKRGADAWKDWIPDIKFLFTKEQLCETDPGVEELAEYA